MYEIRLPYESRADRERAAQCCADLVKEGVTFRAEVVIDRIATFLITLTGGF